MATGDPQKEFLEKMGRDHCGWGGSGVRAPSPARGGPPFRLRVFESGRELTNVGLATPLFLMGSDRWRCHLADTEGGDDVKPIHAALVYDPRVPGRGAPL